jgi:imidazole glycerol-phosphate synthase subunit HisF
MSLKKRVIPNIKVVDDVVYTTEKFKLNRVVGEINSIVEYFYYTQADEIILCDISKKKNFNLFLKKIKKISNKFSLPMSIGCSIRTVDMAKKIMDSGADKIIISSGLFNTGYKLVDKIANIFGTQSIQISLDYKIDNTKFLIRNKNNSYLVKDLNEHIKLCVENGAGEIILNSINHDGSKSGFDIEILKHLNNINLPILLSGGCGYTYDIYKAFKENISGVICGTLFPFANTSCIEINSYLKSYAYETKKLEFD